MENHTRRYEVLHQLYVQLTGLAVPFTMQRLLAWEIWCGKGKHSEQDLGMVVALIKRRIREDRRRPESLKFSNLIQNMDRFEEDLAEAKAELALRKPKPIDHGKSAVLRATGRAVQATTTEARSADQILKDAQALKQFQEWRKENQI